MSPALRIGATGFGLIAVCYGFARFAFGMFLPQIDADLDLGASLSGVISGGSTTRVDGDGPGRPGWS